MKFKEPRQCPHCSRPPIQNAGAYRNHVRSCSAKIARPLFVAILEATGWRQTGKKKRDNWRDPRRPRNVWPFDVAVMIQRGRNEKANAEAKL